MSDKLKGINVYLIALIYSFFFIFTSFIGLLILAGICILLYFFAYNKKDNMTPQKKILLDKKKKNAIKVAILFGVLAIIAYIIYFIRLDKQPIITRIFKSLYHSFISEET